MNSFRIQKGLKNNSLSTRVNAVFAYQFSKKHVITIITIMDIINLYNQCKESFLAKRASFRNYLKVESKNLAILGNLNAKVANLVVKFDKVIAT
ncbi:MAG: hypothetical protein CL589_13395 [Alteromonadaceae bacterium]|nr:hypothetical protein [Alteromonadaceae bacterium]MAX43608.1 hypothetical protein [Alteromonadaceae bacterium]|tara:strand:+ start:444 stop:725 length:282 start_codon:yes stop_codon:yes gene_type:complete